MNAKSLFPKSLFARALLILLLPTVFIQVVMVYVFFDRHWDNITRHMARSLAGEAAFIAEQLTRQPPNKIPQVVKDFDRFTDVDIFIDPVASFDAGATSNEYPEFQDQLRALIKQPFTLQKLDSSGMVEVRILLAREVVRLEVSPKRLESRTTGILVAWMVGTTSAFLLIAILFLRNQIRPIRRLAKAADNFGRGIDMPDFRPSGASEVRIAAHAFITMRERIHRMVKTRTEMLAGISHDLRTPLTRMKLQLAMLENEEVAHELAEDVEQMEHMVEEYLDFARGDNREEASLVSLRTLLANIVDDYRRQKANVTFEMLKDVMAEVRVISFRRMLCNLIDNAVRYGECCVITLNSTPSAFEIVIDDEGPGIPPEKYEEVFQPFRRLEASRNIKTGGVGLGLTIARDITLVHGGNIRFARSPKGGLRVTLNFPLHKDHL